MDRGAWWTTVHRLQRVRHDSSDLACMHHSLLVRLQTNEKNQTCSLKLDMCISSSPEILLLNIHPRQLPTQVHQRTCLRIHIVALLRKIGNWGNQDSSLGESRQQGLLTKPKVGFFQRTLILTEWQQYRSRKKEGTNIHPQE